MMSGCLVWCKFCATGQLKQWRPLTEEIVAQVDFVVHQHKPDLVYPMVPGTLKPLIVDAQTRRIPHNGRRVGQVPVYSSGTVSIGSLTAKCRYNHTAWAML